VDGVRIGTVYTGTGGNGGPVSVPVQTSTVHLGPYCVTLCTDTLRGSWVAGLSYVVKVGINRNRISADETTQNCVQIATAQTVFKTSNISRICVNCMFTCN